MNAALYHTKRHNMDPDEAFKDVEKLLYSIAWKYTLKYYIPFEETQREVFWSFTKVFNRYDPLRTKKASLSTTCAFVADHDLRTLVMRRMKSIPLDELNEETAGFAPPARSECMETIEDLSQDAQELVRLLVETPKEILGWAHEWNPQVRAISPSQLLKRVKKYLVEKGKQREIVEAAEMEVRQRFQQVWAS